MGDYKVWQDERGNIRFSISGIYTKRDAESMIEKINDISKGGGRVKMIMNLSETERGTVVARKIIIKHIKADSSIYERIALYGANTMNRVMVNLVVKASGREDKVRCFGTENEALIWLRE